MRFVFEQVFGLNPDGRLGIEVSWQMDMDHLSVFFLGEAVCGVPDFPPEAQGRTAEAR